MTKKDFITLVLEGKPLIIVEYRGITPDVIKYRDKKTGNAVERTIAKHSVEMGNSQVMVTEWLPDGTKPDSVVQPFKKGAKCVLELEGMEPMQGFYKASGKLFPIDLTGA